MERPSPGRRVVSNGDMDALITDTWAGRTVEMVVDLEPEILAEVGGHIDELSYGASEFALCLSATAQQAAGNASVTLWSDDGITVKVDKNLAPCLSAAQALAERGIALTMTIRDNAGRVLGRNVDHVDTESLSIRLSTGDLGVY